MTLILLCAVGALFVIVIAMFIIIMQLRIQFAAILWDMQAISDRTTRVSANCTAKHLAITHQ